MIFALVFLFAFAVAFAATPLAGWVGRRVGLVDQPGGRRRHQGAIPRTGGLALCAAFLAAAFAAQYMPVPRQDANEIVRFAGLIAGGVFIAALGLVDDRWNLAPRWQYLIQISAAVIAIVFLIFVQYIPNPFMPRQHILFPYWLTIVFTIFWIAGMINTVNWLDGLNGLAAGVTAIVSGVLFIHMAFRLDPPQTSVSLLPLALAGACLGFLPWNFSSRIFMGSGSWFLGYTLGCLAIIGGAKVATVLLVMAVPIIDVAWLIFRRARRGVPGGTAGRDHLHFRLLDAGIPERGIVLGYYAFCAASGALALLTSPGLFKLVALGVLGALVILVLWRAEKKSAR